MLRQRGPMAIEKPRAKKKFAFAEPSGWAELSEYLTILSSLTSA